MPIFKVTVQHRRTMPIFIAGDSIDSAGKFAADSTNAADIIALLDSEYEEDADTSSLVVCSVALATPEETEDYNVDFYLLTSKE